LVFTLVPAFAWRYRRRSADQVPPPPGHSLRLEILWSLPPLAVVLILFAWGARLYIDVYSPPAGALEIFVTGKQWMWKIQHPDGKREINALHVPVNQPIELTMTSEDVIHSFYVPAFRIKRDVVPGRYSRMWFEATRTGRYHLFCAEYCGTEHSRMTGTVVVMTQSAYDDWLAGGAEAGASMASSGQELFRRHGCVTCHSGQSGARGPNLAGLYGKKVTLTTGEVVTADEAYLHESILLPNAKTVAGYSTVMPTFKGQISEEGVAKLIAFIRTLKPSGAAKDAAGGGTP